VVVVKLGLGFWLVKKGGVAGLIGGDLRCPSKFVISFSFSFSFFGRLVLKGIGVAWKRMFLAFG
jgi:hypothetical protein